MNFLRVTPFLFITLWAAVAFGQEAAPVADEHVCNEEFAKFLVDQQVSEGRSVTDAAKRIRILTKSADFLWKFDQPRAREYFTEGYKVATDRYKEKGFERKEYEGGGIYESLPDYRFEVVRAIAKHDPGWAQKLFEEILKEYEETAKDRSPGDKMREVDSLMSIALESIQSNPALSWFIYRRLMRMDLDLQWYWHTFAAARKDPAFADQLYAELINSHANATPKRVVYLSAYPFASPRMLGYGSWAYVANIPEGLAPDPQLQAQFIDLLLRRSDAFVSDPTNFSQQAEGYDMPDAVYIVTALQELEPIAARSFPAFLPRLHAVRSKATAMLSEENRKSMAERDDLNREGTKTFEDRIAELEKAESEGKLTDAMILRTLISRPKTEDHFRMLEPWIEKITDAEGRAGSMNYFWFIRSQLAIKEKRLGDAQKYAGKVPEVEHQAILWFELAEKQLADINDAAGVYTTLRDVGSIARKADDSVGKARVLLGLANLFEKVNHSFAISELSDAVGVINKLKDADLQSSYIMRFVKVEGMAFGASFSTPGYDLETTFKTVSKNDFSLTLTNAKAIEDKYYRTLAVIAIAGNCIDRPKPKRRAAK